MPWFQCACFVSVNSLAILLRDHLDMRVDHPSKPMPLPFPVIRSTLELWAHQELVSHTVPLQATLSPHNLTMDASTYG